METRRTKETAHEQIEPTIEYLMVLLRDFIKADDEWQSQYSTEEESDKAYNESVRLQNEFRRIYFTLSKEEQEQIDNVLEKESNPKDLYLIKRNIEN